MLLAVIVVLIVFWFIVNLRQFVVSLFKQISLDIPSFKSYPIFGHFWSFQGLKSQDAFLETNKFSSDFPEISKLWQFHHLNIFVNSPKLIERVLLSKACLQRPLLLLKFFDVNEGLLSSRYDQWTHDRRLMIQFFSPKRIDSYTESFSRCVDLLIVNLRENCSDQPIGQPTDLLPLFEKCALRGVCSTLFGMNYMDGKVDEIYRRTAEIFEANTRTFEAGLKNPFRFLEWVHKCTSNYRKVKSAHCYLTKVLTEMKFDHTKTDGESLLEYLLKNESENLTKKQISEHLITYLNAGLDTTAAHLHYSILFLAMHQNHQEKLFEEVATVDKDNHEAMMKLDFLDRVIKESFRLAPPIFLIGRETIDDFEISPGLIIPNHTPLAINTFVLHRRKDIYGDDSHKFNPDNFLPEKIAERHSFSFQPFSTGRRNCIGYRFATVFIKLLMPELIRNFKFTTQSKPEDMHFKYGMTLKLTRDHLVSIERRQQ